MTVRNTGFVWFVCSLAWGWPFELIESFALLVSGGDKGGEL